MFEQSILTNGPAGKKAWTTMLGFTGQAALLSLAVMAPIVFPQVLPMARIDLRLVPPVPPGPTRLGGEVKQQPAHSKAMLKTFQLPLTAFQPSTVPTQVWKVIDAPQVGSYVPGLPPGFGTTVGIPGGIPMIAEVPHIAPPVVAAVTPTPEPTITRYKEGGRVRLGNILHRGDLIYPAMARSARITGDVVLECVVGTDGHITDVKVKSGNPFLVKAAAEAAWKWIYEPTRLNGDPIEIVTLMTFHFTLNN